MNGAGLGSGAVARTSALSSAAARAGAAAAALALGGSGAEVQGAVQDMLDQGLVRRDTEHLAYCPAGHAFDCALAICPRCGAEPGSAPSSDDLVSADDEILREEDRSVSDPPDQSALDEADRPGFLERLEFALIEAGCARPLELATELAGLWRGELPGDTWALDLPVGERVWTEEDVARIGCARDSLSRAEASVLGQGRGSKESAADIRIWREGLYLRWEIVDHLQGLAPTARDGFVRLGGIRLTRDRANKLIEERKERLEALVKALVAKRKAFFDEKDSVIAMNILRDQPLTQKEVCAETGIPPTALSRWCDYKGRQTRSSKKVSGRAGGISLRTGIELNTPHGVLSLAEFFSAPARAKGTRGRSQEAVEREVDQVLAESKEQGLDTDEIIKKVLDDHGIDLAGRTVRKYRKNRERPEPPNG